MEAFARWLNKIEWNIQMNVHLKVKFKEEENLCNARQQNQLAAVA